jgi:hypothetical protein
MALLHKATLSPTKRELLAAWLPTRDWWPGEAGPEPIGAYRFDDPSGEIGLEGFLVRCGEDVVHAALTYRARPLAGGEANLVGTAEHSVLGTRWVYDGCGDPVWVAALATAVLTGGVQAEEYFEVDGRRESRAPTIRVQGSGRSGAAVPVADSVSCRDEGPVTLVRAGDLELVVVRRLGGEAAPVAAEETLVASWDGGGPDVLAGVRPAVAARTA